MCIIFFLVIRSWSSSLFFICCLIVIVTWFMCDFSRTIIFWRWMCYLPVEPNIVIFFGWMCYLPSESKVVVFWLKRENNNSLICHRALIIFILWVEKYIYWNFKFEYNLEFGKNYFVELEKYIYLEWGRLECHLWCMEANESPKSSSTRQIASSLPWCKFDDFEE